MANKKIISVVIPAKDEEENIAFLLEDLFNIIKKMEDYEFEVIVVDDRSKDKTAARASSKNVKILNNLRSSGKGHALITGFEKARGDYFIMMDADYSHRPEDIPAFIKCLEDGAGLVVGSRIYGGSDEYTRIRAFGNIILTLSFGLLHHRYLSDALNGFKGFKRDVFENFRYTSKDFEIEIELLVNALRLGEEIVEVPSHERERRYGFAKSKVVKHGLKFFNRIVIEWLRNKFNRRRSPLAKK